MVLSVVLVLAVSVPFQCCHTLSRQRGDKVQAVMTSVPLSTGVNVTCFHSDRASLSTFLLLYPGASVGFSIPGFTCRLRCHLGWEGRWEGVSEWGTHVHPWLIHVIVWQKPPQYCKVISLQLKKKKECEMLAVEGTHSSVLTINP